MRKNAKHSDRKDRKMEVNDLPIPRDSVITEAALKDAWYRFLGADRVASVCGSHRQHLAASEGAVHALWVDLVATLALLPHEMRHIIANTEVDAVPPPIMSCWRPAWEQAPVVAALNVKPSPAYRTRPADELQPARRLPRTPTPAAHPSVPLRVAPLPKVHEKQWHRDDFHPGTAKKVKHIAGQTPPELRCPQWATRKMSGCIPHHVVPRRVANCSVAWYLPLHHAAHRVPRHDWQITVPCNRFVSCANPAFNIFDAKTKTSFYLCASTVPERPDATPLRYDSVVSTCQGFVQALDARVSQQGDCLPRSFKVEGSFPLPLAVFTPHRAAVFRNVTTFSHRVPLPVSLMVLTLESAARRQSPATVGVAANPYDTPLHTAKAASAARSSETEGPLQGTVPFALLHDVALCFEDAAPSLTSLSWHGLVTNADVRVLIAACPRLCRRLRRLKLTEPRPAMSFITDVPIEEARTSLSKAPATAPAANPGTFEFEFGSTWAVSEMISQDAETRTAIAANFSLHSIAGRQPTVFSSLQSLTLPYGVPACALSELLLGTFDVGPRGTTGSESRSIVRVFDISTLTELDARNFPSTVSMTPFVGHATALRILQLRFPQEITSNFTRTVVESCRQLEAITVRARFMHFQRYHFQNPHVLLELPCLRRLYLCGCVRAPIFESVRTTLDMAASDVGPFVDADRRFGRRSNSRTVGESRGEVAAGSMSKERYEELCAMFVERRLAGLLTVRCVNVPQQSLPPLLRKSGIRFRRQARGPVW